MENYLGRLKVEQKGMHDEFARHSGLQRTYKDDGAMALISSLVDLIFRTSAKNS